MHCPLLLSSASSSLFSRTAVPALAALAALGLAIVPAHAQTQAANRADISGSNVIDWNQTGSNYSAVDNPTTVTSSGGISAVVSSETGGSFSRIDQSNGWDGAFAPGDALLWNQGSGPVTFSFTQGVGAIGTQIQSDYYGLYTAQLQTFGQDGSLLSTFFANGTANGGGDNSAVFLGASDPTADIYKATFSLTSASYKPNDFALNSVSVAVPAAVPEASTTASLGLMLALGLGGLVVARRRKAQVAA